ncbi:MAG: RDD family protein [Microthrixaceae bacterium]
MHAGVITPEAVVLELPTAGVVTRALARLVDLAVQLTAVAFLAIVMSPVGGFASPQLTALVLGFVGLFVVPIGMELIWRGSSAGKAMFGLRVVGADGAPEAPRQAIVRGLVAMVDLYLSLGALAVISAMSTRTGQRPGDLSAGTVVIRTRNLTASTTPIAFHPPAGYEHYVASLDVGGLTDEDFALVRELLLRVRELEPESRSRLVIALAEDVRARLRHTLPGPIDPELWLVCVASAYQLRQGGLLADAALGLAPLAPRSVATEPKVRERRRRR